MQNSQQTVQLKIMWRSMLGSLGIYAAISLFVKPLLGPDSGLRLPLTGALAVVALAIVAGTIVVRRVALAQPLSRGEIDLSTAEGAARLSAVSVILWALSESIGIFGLVLFVLFGEAAVFYAFLAASAALLLMHAPRASAPEAAARSEDLARADVKIG